MDSLQEKTLDNRHMDIINDTEKLAVSLNELFYANSNEKILLREKLSQLLGNSTYSETLDLGAGPGLLADVLLQHSKHLTLVDHSPYYYQTLKSKFPDATIEINSILDFSFDKKYDLILLSHVLYYIATTEWEALLKKLYGHLQIGGKLIVVHAPCHRIQQIFKNKREQISHIAYMDQQAIDQTLLKVGPVAKDHFQSVSYYDSKLDYAFAQKFTEFFFGTTIELFVENYRQEFDELLSLFKQVGEQLAIEYHHDIFVFQK